MPFSKLMGLRLLTAVTIIQCHACGWIYTDYVGGDRFWTSFVVLGVMCMVVGVWASLVGLWLPVAVFGAPLGPCDCCLLSELSTILEMYSTTEGIPTLATCMCIHFSTFHSVMA